MELDRIEGWLPRWWSGIRRIEMGILRRQGGRYEASIVSRYGPFGLKMSKEMVKEDITFQEALMVIIYLCDSLGSDTPPITIYYANPGVA